MLMGGQFSEVEGGNSENGTKMRMFFFASILMAATWKSVGIDATEVKMQVDTGTDATAILSCIW